MSDIAPNETLANLIFIFHTIIVLFVLFAPFTKIPAILILHITFCICLLVHWYSSSNICSLSLMESKFRGLNYTETFTHKFISPIYDISESNWIIMCYYITFFVMFLSVYNLIQSEKFIETYNCICALKFDENTPTSKKIESYIECIKPLFIL